MSGHSKWSTIKRKKGAIDAKRSKIFSRIIKEISVAIKEGGSSDPDFNPRLRAAITNAKGVNMPKDNIERAIKKASTDSAAYEQLTFEATGQGGVALFIECLTDNHLRTVANIRSILNRKGGTLGKNGSLAYLFERKAIFTIPKKNYTLDFLELELIDAGLDEMEEDGERLIITVKIEDFGNMQKKLEEMEIEIENSEFQRIPNTRKTLDKDTALRALKLIDSIEDDDDVQNVFHDIEMTDELSEALEEE
jgi:YebC/PmpR family DNA-binding regulatory protein